MRTSVIYKPQSSKESAAGHSCHVQAAAAQRLSVSCCMLSVSPADVCCKTNITALDGQLYHTHSLTMACLASKHYHHNTVRPSSVRKRTKVTANLKNELGITNATITLPAIQSSGYATSSYEI